MRSNPFSLKSLAQLVIGLSATFIAASSSAQETVRINEFLASNRDGITDSDGEYSDWIEIFNAGNEEVDLSGYSLTDNSESPNQWSIPDGTKLGSGGFLLIFASGKDRAVAGEELHTNFRLNSQEMYIGLFDSTQTAVHELKDLPAQQRDVSYGLGVGGDTVPQDYIPDGSDATWLVPAEEIGTDWQQPDFDDGAWTAAKLGLGFDYDDITGENGNLKDAMQGKNASVYVRVPFNVESPSRVVSLRLSMRYEDGFAAFLNGHEIASENRPNPLEWNSAATNSNPDSEAVVPVNYDLTSEDFAGRLVAGENILAIHGMNRTRGGSDALVYPNLSGTISAAAEVGEGFFTTPTPGLPNSNKVDGFVADTVTTPTRGFYEEPFEVTITNPTEGAKIYYTLDETEPTPEDGTPYTAPIPIDKTTVLRTAAYLTGHKTSRVDTHTYLFLDDVIAQRTMRTQVTEDEVLGPQMRDALTALPTISIVSTHTRELQRADAQQQHADQPEVTCSAEWLNPDGSEGFQINSGIARFGGFYTNFPKKQYRLFFRRKYGKGTLEYPVFDGFDYDIPRLRSSIHSRCARVPTTWSPVAPTCPTASLTTHCWRWARSLRMADSFTYTSTVSTGDSTTCASAGTR